MNRWIWVVLLVALVPALYQSSVLAGTYSHYGQTVTVGDDPLDCLFCHDGGIAKRVINCTTECNYRSAHVISTPYPGPERGQEFVPRDEVVARGLRLPGGKVVCVTCHDLGNNTPDHLVVTMDGSALCRACHLK